MHFHKRKVVLFVLFTSILVGCGRNIDESLYEESIEYGLDYFAIEKYVEAEEQFNRALEEKENDEFAAALLAQTTAYHEALKLFEEENFEEGFVKVQTVIDTPNGATSIFSKAEELLNKQKRTQEELVEEAEKAADEKAELEKKEAEAAAQLKAKEEDEKVKVKEETKSYEYSDFIGYYLNFNSASRDYSGMVAGIGHDLVIIGWQASTGNSYEILEKSIDGNTLTIEYYSPDSYVEGEGVYGKMGITLDDVSNESTISFSFEPESKFYKVSYDEVLSYDYSLVDFVN